MLTHRVVGAVCIAWPKPCLLGPLASCRNAPLSGLLSSTRIRVAFSLWCSLSSRHWTPSSVGGCPSSDEGGAEGGSRSTPSRVSRPNCNCENLFVVRQALTNHATLSFVAGERTSWTGNRRASRMRPFSLSSQLCTPQSHLINDLLFSCLLRLASTAIGVKRAVPIVCVCATQVNK